MIKGLLLIMVDSRAVEEQVDFIWVIKPIVRNVLQEYRDITVMSFGHEDKTEPDGHSKARSGHKLRVQTTGKH